MSRRNWMFLFAAIPAIAALLAIIAYVLPWGGVVLGFMQNSLSNVAQFMMAKYELPAWLLMCIFIVCFAAAARLVFTVGRFLIGLLSSAPITSYPISPPPTPSALTLNTSSKGKCMMYGVEVHWQYTPARAPLLLVRTEVWCPLCKLEFDDFQDSRNYRHCRVCDTRYKVPPVGRLQQEILGSLRGGKPPSMTID